MLGGAREQRYPMLPCSESVLLADYFGYDCENNTGTETLRHKTGQRKPLLGKPMSLD